MTETAGDPTPSSICLGLESQTSGGWGRRSCWSTEEDETCTKMEHRKRCEPLWEGLFRFLSVFPRNSLLGIRNILLCLSDFLETYKQSVSAQQQSRAWADKEVIRELLVARWKVGPGSPSLYHILQGEEEVSRPLWASLNAMDNLGQRHRM